jgi:hypothetical protein
MVANWQWGYRKMQNFKMESGTAPNGLKYGHNVPKYNSEQTGEVPIFRKINAQNFLSTKVKYSCINKPGLMY